MELQINFNDPKIREKVTSDKFGMFVSSEWKRLIDPYTPRDTGVMQNTAVLNAWQIHYKTKYASRLYKGENFTFQKKNPYSTYEWDVKAAEAGQLDKLYRILNNGLQSGRF